MLQLARNVTDESAGCLLDQRYLLHDGDSKFCTPFRGVLRSGAVQLLSQQGTESKSECLHLY